jgi:hypothetical protein
MTVSEYIFYFILFFQKWDNFQLRPIENHPMIEKNELKQSFFLFNSKKHLTLAFT